jgi:hypothetical protein
MTKPTAVHLTREMARDVLQHLCVDIDLGYVAPELVQAISAIANDQARIALPCEHGKNADGKCAYPGCNGWRVVGPS